MASSHLEQHGENAALGGRGGVGASLPLPALPSQEAGWAHLPRGTGRAKGKAEPTKPGAGAHIFAAYTRPRQKPKGHAF